MLAGGPRPTAVEAANRRLPPFARGPGPTLVDRAFDSALTDAVATDTGGLTVRNYNDLRSITARLSDESRAYYLIGYYPSNPRRDGRFRQIDVRVQGKGVKVRARKGCYALDAR